MANAKAKASATTNKTTNRKEEVTMKGNQFEQLMAAINGISNEVSSLRADVDELKGEKEKATAKGKTTKANGKATETKATAKGKATEKKSTKKASAKANGKANGKKSAPTTKAEAIEAWKSERYSDKERKAYGVAAREVREEMMAENKAKVKTVKGEKVYADDYYVGAKWKREFNKRMEARGFSR